MKYIPQEIRSLRTDIVTENGSTIGEIRSDINESYSSFGFQVNIYNTDNIENNKELINRHIQDFYEAFTQSLPTSNWSFVKLPNLYDEPTTLPYEE